MTEKGFLCTHSDQAIELVISLLKGRAKKQPSGFQVSSRSVRRALAEHYDRSTREVKMLATFVMHALVARGILKPFNKTEYRVVFGVNTVTATDSRGSYTPAVFPSHA